jgi:hypothetical protein
VKNSGNPSCKDRENFILHTQLYTEKANAYYYYYYYYYYYNNNIISDGIQTIQSKEITIKTGIFQGDSLSALWFCVCLNPLSQTLKNTEKATS